MNKMFLNILCQE